MRAIILNFDFNDLVAVPLLQMYNIPPPLSSFPFRGWLKDETFVSDYQREKVQACCLSEAHLE